ncbi:MAG TPA: HAD family hydrolase, partial [Actinotalea sp.]|nr:HAD family hydrolase [Actinotalea sp.]
DVIVAAAPEGVFRAIVAGDDVSRAKPAPDGYLDAARALGVDPRRCLAVEDSPPGVTSALSAGTHVIAVDADQPVTAHPRVRVASLAEVGEILGLA